MWALTVGGISGAGLLTGLGSLGTEGIDAETGTKFEGDRGHLQGPFRGVNYCKVQGSQLSTECRATNPQLHTLRHEKEAGISLSTVSRTTGKPAFRDV